MFIYYPAVVYKTTFVKSPHSEGEHEQEREPQRQIFHISKRKWCRPHIFQWTYLFYRETHWMHPTIGEIRKTNMSWFLVSVTVGVAVVGTFSNDDGD